MPILRRRNPRRRREMPLLQRISRRQDKTARKSSRAAAKENAVVFQQFLLDCKFSGDRPFYAAAGLVSSEDGPDFQDRLDGGDRGGDVVHYQVHGGFAGTVE